MNLALILVFLRKAQKIVNLFVTAVNPFMSQVNHLLKNRVKLQANYPVNHPVTSLTKKTTFTTTITITTTTKTVTIMENVVLIHHAQIMNFVTLISILVVFVRVALLMNLALILVFLRKAQKIVNLFVTTVNPVMNEPSESLSEELSEVPSKSPSELPSDLPYHKDHFYYDDYYYYYDHNSDNYGECSVDSPCPNDEFCNFDFDSSGFCKGCPTDESFLDIGLPSKGSENCQSTCDTQY